MNNHTCSFIQNPYLFENIGYICNVCNKKRLYNNYIDFNDPNNSNMDTFKNIIKENKKELNKKELNKKVIYNEEKYIIYYKKYHSINK